MQTTTQAKMQTMQIKMQTITQAKMQTRIQTAIQTKTQTQTTIIKSKRNLQNEVPFFKS